MEDSDVRARGDQLELRINGLAHRLTRPAGRQLAMRIFSRLGWSASQQLGVRVSGIEQPVANERELLDLQERLRANGATDVEALARPLLAGPWGKREAGEQPETGEQRGIVRRFTKESTTPAPSTQPSTPRRAAKATRAPERQHGDPTIDVVLFEDAGEQLRYEIQHWYLMTVPPSQRQEWPLRTYTFGPRFLSDVEEQGRQISRSQIVAAIVDVTCTRAQEMNSRSPRQLRAGESAGDRRNITRSDGAVAWRANISHGTPAARRIMWWVLPTGEIELARVAVHDDVEMP